MSKFQKSKKTTRKIKTRKMTSKKSLSRKNKLRNQFQLKKICQTNASLKKTTRHTKTQLKMMKNRVNCTIRMRPDKFRLT